MPCDASPGKARGFLGGARGPTCGLLFWASVYLVQGGMGPCELLSPHRERRAGKTHGTCVQCVAGQPTGGRPSPSSSKRSPKAHKLWSERCNVHRAQPGRHSPWACGSVFFPPAHVCEMRALPGAAGTQLAFRDSISQTSTSTGSPFLNCRTGSRLALQLSLHNGPSSPFPQRKAHLQPS